MSDAFRLFFLESIQATIQQDASQEALLALLKFAAPSLTIDEMLAMPPKDRSRLMKVLKTRIHPDKHPNESSVTEIFQNVQIFYDECIGNLSKGSSTRDRDSKASKRRRKRSRSGQLATGKAYPSNYSCFDQWPYMKECITTVASSDTPKSLNMPNANVLPAYQAYRCINSRGSVAHGRIITRHETFGDVEKKSEKKYSVQEIFDSFGGAKELETVETIKDELMNCGPVVSASFRLLDAYLERLNVSENSFVREASGGTHELLIVGWCLTPYGEAWQVEPIMNDTDVASQIIEIGFGQFDIDEVVLAPDNSLEYISWQPGPYFDYDFSDVENWREWKEMDLPIGENDLKDLAKCFPSGLMSGEAFVLRDEKKHAHSGTYKVKNIRWGEETNEWFIQVYQFVLEAKDEMIAE